MFLLKKLYKLLKLLKRSKGAWGSTLKKIFGAKIIWFNHKNWKRKFFLIVAPPSLATNGRYFDYCGLTYHFFKKTKKTKKTKKFKKFKKVLYITSILFITISLISCKIDPSKIAEKSNMHKQLYQTNTFIITSYIKNKQYLDPTKPLYVYIEGDGQAWRTRYRLSDDPTPNDPLTLKLAAIDQHPNVVYIARPCQFTPLHLDHHCSPKYWSTARYSLPVVNSINQTIDLVKKQIGDLNQPVHLVGFSGGATVAGLIAAHRNDIKSLRTIAGNLDHDAVSNKHKTTKLDLSLNLIDFAKKISDIPQIHYIGENDQIIPVYVIKNFVDQTNSFNKNNCSKYVVLKKMDHYHGWEAVWSKTVDNIPTCLNI